MAHPMESFFFVHIFQIQLEFTSVGFCGGRKTVEHGEKPSVQGKSQKQTYYPTDEC